MLPHGHDLRNDRLARPLNTENLCELLQVLCSSLSDREDRISQPSHAQVTQLLVEELDTQLASKKGNIFNDSQTDSPLLVFGQLHNGRK